MWSTRRTSLPPMAFFMESYTTHIRMSYAALELITFFIKRHYIQREFDIDLLKLMHYSLKKHGVEFGCMIVLSFMFTIFTSELDHVRNDFSIQLVQECFAHSHEMSSPSP